MGARGEKVDASYFLDLKMSRRHVLPRSVKPTPPPSVKRTKKTVEVVKATQGSLSGGGIPELYLKPMNCDVNFTKRSYLAKCQKSRCIGSKHVDGIPPPRILGHESRPLKIGLHFG